MKTLALDLGTKTGWALSDGPSGVWDLSVRRDESAGMRLIRLRGKLATIKDSNVIDVIVFEAARNARPGMQGALVVLAEFQAVVKTFCEDFDIEYRGYSPSEIKKHAIPGKGKRDKAAMLRAAKRKWPDVDFIDDNHADACFLLDLFQSEVESC